jgi:hypothetical protein
MPIHFERDDERRRIAVISVGTITLEETLAFMNRQAAEGMWSFDVLYDARASKVPPTPAEVHAVVQRLGVLTTRHGPRGRVAFVAGDAALTKMGQRYAALGELTALNARVFATLEEAETWLDGHD